METIQNKENNDYSEGNLLTFNVRGSKYQFPSETIIHSNYTSTLNKIIHDNTGREIFINRCSSSFDLILDYHSSGVFHLPENFCLPRIQDELDFWNISGDSLAECCWNVYQDKLEQDKTVSSVCAETIKSTLNSGDHSCEGTQRDNPGIVPSASQRVWNCMEDSRSSKLAMVYASVSTIVTVVAIVSLALETSPALRYADESLQVSSNMSNPKIQSLIGTKPHVAHEIVIYCSIILLSIETIIRFIMCPVKKLLVTDPANVCDTLCLVPALVLLCLIASWNFRITEQNVYSFLWARTFSMLLGLRLIRHIRKIGLVRVLAMTLKCSSGLYLFTTAILAFVVLLFGSAIFAAEMENPTNFWSIPEGFWWAIVTITTVGYGDMYPVTIGGYIVGSVCAVCGIMVLAMPIPILSSNFTNYYKAYMIAKRVRAHRRRLDKKSSC